LRVFRGSSARTRVLGLAAVDAGAAGAQVLDHLAVAAVAALSACGAYEPDDKESETWMWPVALERSRLLWEA
jgi:hypothetical protein